MDACESAYGCRGYVRGANWRGPGCPEIGARLRDSRGFAGDLCPEDSSRHREIGELWHAVDSVSAGPRIDGERTGNRRGARVDQIGIRSLFETVRWMS